MGHLFWFFKQELVTREKPRDWDCRRQSTRHRLAGSVGEESRASWLRSALARWDSAQSDKNPPPGLTASVSLAAEKRAARCKLGPGRRLGQFSVFQIHCWFRKRQADERQKEEEEKQNSCCKHNGLPSQPGIQTAVPTLPGFLPRVTPAWFPPKTDPS